MEGVPIEETEMIVVVGLKRRKKALLSINRGGRRKEKISERNLIVGVRGNSPYVPKKGWKHDR